MAIPHESPAAPTAVCNAVAPLSGLVADVVSFAAISVHAVKGSVCAALFAATVSFLPDLLAPFALVLAVEQGMDGIGAMLEHLGQGNERARV